LSPTVRAWLPFVAAALACGGALGLGFATGVLDLGARAPLALLVVLPWAWHVHLRGRAGLSVYRHLLVGLTRFVLLLALVLALCELRTTRTDDRVVLVFALDYSDSIPADSTKDALRFALATSADKPPADEVGLVLFGRNAGVELPPGASLPFESINVAIDRSATDLGEGLATAAALLPPGRPARIVLATDGADTAGRLDAVLDDLAARGVAVDVLPVEYDGGRETWIEKVELPMRVKLGDTIEPSVLLAASAPGRGVLVLTDNDVEIARQTVEWPAGKTRLSAALPLRAPGYHEIRARLEPEPGSDFWAKNNVGFAGVYVAGRGRVLVVKGEHGDGADAELVAAALRAHQREVEITTPPALPGQALPLLPFDAIVIVDAPREEFALPQMQAVHDAVFHQGSGLLMLGSPHTFGPGGYGGTPIEQALPVSTDLPDSKQLPKGALAIILHTCEFPAGNTWAKQITLQAMRVLHPRDLVGALAYDHTGRDQWLFPLTPAGEYERLALKVNAAQIGDMPGFGATMRMALDALQQTDAALKHVIIISDGDPQPPPPALLASYQAAKVTVSTVTVFPHGNVDSQVMREIAAATSGRHYRPDNANELPAIFVKEAKTARTPAILERTFVPSVLLPAPVLAGIDAVPPLHGMVLTRPKGRALTVLEGPDEEIADPVLAQWRYGVGAAAAFTSDLGGRWGRDFVASERHRAFVHQLVGDVARQERPQRLFARAVAAQGQGVLQVEDHGTDDALLDVLAQVRGPDGTRSVALVQVGPRRYEARFPLGPVGRYEVTISAGAERTHTGFALAYGAEYARFRSDPECLQRIAQRTGGRLLRGDENGAELFARPVELPKNSRPWVTALLWLAAGLVLLEVAFRRVQISFTRRHAPQALQTDALLARKRAAEARLAARTAEPPRAVSPAPGAEPDQARPPESAPRTTPPPPPPAATDPPGAAPTTTTERLLARKRAQGGGSSKTTP